VGIWSRWTESRCRRPLRRYLEEVKHASGLDRPSLRSCEAKLKAVSSRAVRSRHPWAPAFLADALRAMAWRDGTTVCDLIKKLGASSSAWAPGVLSDFAQDRGMPPRLCEQAVTALGEKTTPERCVMLEDCANRGTDYVAQAAFEALARAGDDPRTRDRAIAVLIRGLSHEDRDCRTTCLSLLVRSDWNPASPDEARAYLVASNFKHVKEPDARRILSSLRDRSCVDELWAIANSQSAYAEQAFSMLEEMAIETTRFAAMLADGYRSLRMRPSVERAIARHGRRPEFVSVLRTVLQMMEPQDFRCSGALDAFCRAADLSDKAMLAMLLARAEDLSWHDGKWYGSAEQAIRRIGVHDFRSELLDLLRSGSIELKVRQLALGLLADDEGAEVPHGVIAAWLREQDSAAHAALYLAKHPDPRFYDLLVDALGHPSTLTSRFVPRALGALRDGRAVAPLLESLQGCREDEAAGRALLDLGEPEGDVANSLLLRAWEKVSWDEPFLTRTDEVLSGGFEYRWVAEHHVQCQWIDELIHRCPPGSLPARIAGVIDTLPCEVSCHYSTPYAGEYDASRRDEIVTGRVDFTGWKMAARGSWRKPVSNTGPSLSPQ
jgi:HEAT repeat protein